MKDRAKVEENVSKIVAAIVLIDTHNILDIWKNDIFELWGLRS